MPRPRKFRMVCRMPCCTDFGPAHGHARRMVVMTVDEYEAIRLIDREGLTQEACAARMGIARTTVQAIYAAARKKLAECLVDGLWLSIAGGDVQFCGEPEHGGPAPCPGRACWAHREGAPEEGRPRGHRP